MGIEKSKQEYTSLYEKAKEQLKAINLEESALGQLAGFIKDRLQESEKNSRGQVLTFDT
jgi:hypothetical protein